MHGYIIVDIEIAIVEIFVLSAYLYKSTIWKFRKRTATPAKPENWFNSKSESTLLGLNIRTQSSINGTCMPHSLQLSRSRVYTHTGT